MFEQEFLQLSVLFVYFAELQVDLLFMFKALPVFLSLLIFFFFLHVDLHLLKVISGPAYKNVISCKRCKENNYIGMSKDMKYLRQIPYSRCGGF